MLSAKISLILNYELKKQSKVALAFYNLDPYCDTIFFSSQTTSNVVYQSMKSIFADILCY